MSIKTVQQVLPPVPPHMVGDGFRVGLGFGVGAVVDFGGDFAKHPLGVTRAPR